MTVLNIPFTAKVEGFYTLRRYKADGTLVQEVAPVKNLITNLGLDQLGRSGSFMDWCFVGTGTTAPAVTDVALASYLAKTSSVQSTSGSNAGAPYYEYMFSRTFRFPVGAATGNITEVGVGYISGSPENRNTCSRALTVDGGGSPITITVLADEYLDVTYTFVMYPPLTDYSGSFVMSGTTINYTTRLAKAANVQAQPTASSGYTIVTWTSQGYATTGAALTLGAITSNGPTGGTEFSLSTFTPSPAAYVTGSYAGVIDLSWGLSDGNPPVGNTIRGMRLRTGDKLSADFQMVFTPGIAKTSTQIMSLSVSFAWARH